MNICERKGKLVDRAVPVLALAVAPYRGFANPVKDVAKRFQPCKQPRKRIRWNQNCLSEHILMQGVLMASMCYGPYSQSHAKPLQRIGQKIGRDVEFGNAEEGPGRSSRSKGGAP